VGDAVTHKDLKLTPELLLSLGFVHRVCYGNAAPVGGYFEIHSEHIYYSLHLDKARMKLDKEFFPNDLPSLLLAIAKQAHEDGAEYGEDGLRREFRELLELE